MNFFKASEQSFIKFNGLWVKKSKKKFMEFFKISEQSLMFFNNLEAIIKQLMALIMR